jgi:uroporphyrinogen decarboxylase
MTLRERCIAALERRPIEGQVPHFELIFSLTMEAFGKIHPDYRSYHHWDQMEQKERDLHRKDMAELYIAIAERFGHCAIYLRPNPRTVEESNRLVDLIREKSGDKFFLFRGGDATFGIPDGSHMVEFCTRLMEEPEKQKSEALRMVEEAIQRAELFSRHGGLDGLCLATDYCFNTGPFLSPAQFSEFVAPYLAKLISAYRAMGFYVIKHTDGNVMPILDQIVQAGPHALHSLDPQAKVDIAEVKRLYGNRLCLIGNVNCGLLSSGTDEEVLASIRYALKSGMPGGGYIFSTSNSIYPGMSLSRYEMMLKVLRSEGTYPQA